MRRLLAAAALAVLCTTAAACGGDSGGDSADGPPPPPPGLGSPAAPAGSDNTTEVCTNARTVITDSTVKFTQELSKAMSAAASGGDAANAESVNAVKAMFTEWADGLRAQAEKATNEELKTALTDTAVQIGQVADSIKSLEDLQQADKLLESPEMGEAEKKIEAICG